MLAFDPPGRKSKFKSPYFQTDMVLISHNHENHNGKDVLHGKDNTPPFVIDGPGEYEYRDITVIGMPSFHDNSEGKKEGLNTIYKVTLENIVLLHLGDFGEKTVRANIQEQIGDIDILFLPIGGETVIDPETAAAIANQVEPKIIIPMHYDGASSVKKKAALSDFLKEIGAGDVKPEQKFTFKKKDLPTEDTRVVVLETNI